MRRLAANAPGGALTISPQGRNAEMLGVPATVDELRDHRLEEMYRPRTRGECAGGPRPCPWVRCRHHLFLDVNPATGSIKLNHPDRELHELEQSCALDLAGSGKQTLDEVGVAMNITRERVRQIEESAARHLREAAVDAGLDAAIDGPLGTYHGQGHEVPASESDDPRAESLRAARARKRREAEASRGK